MSDPIIEYRLEQAEKALAALEAELKAFKAAEEELERKRLTWGITALGSVVLTLGGVIWAYRGVIFK